LTAVELTQVTDWLDDDPAVREGDAVLAAAEGGDRVLRMLGAAPRRVAVIDRNPAQRHLVAFKLAALKSLGHAEYLELAGRVPSRRRRLLYQRVSWLLPREADEFWRARLRLVDRGLKGSFERRLASFRGLLRLVHGRARLERFVGLATEAERRTAYEAEWRTYFWRRFGGRLWRRWFGVPEERMERLLFEGRLLAAPPALSAGEFEAAKLHANRVLVVDEAPEDYLRSLPAGSVDAFLLGRLDVRGLDSEIARVAHPGSRISLVTEREAPIRGVRAERAPREAGFFPGHLLRGVFAT
jgi:S-adenosylmethionine:diacylglycerol 3-amino-3-carboxypropyl transferase